MDDKPELNKAAAQQAVDATICSTDSAGDGQGGISEAKPEAEEKVKAYVDFSDFNKNYEEFLKQNNQG